MRDIRYRCRTSYSRALMVYRKALRVTGSASAMLMLDAPEELPALPADIYMIQQAVVERDYLEILHKMQEQRLMMLKVGSRLDRQTARLRHCDYANFVPRLAPLPSHLPIRGHAPAIPPKTCKNPHPQETPMA